MSYFLLHYVVMLLILGAAAAGLALIAIWAGWATRPVWYWRVAVVFAALAALFPIEAYEPAALFLMVMPFTTLGTFLLARRWRLNLQASAEQSVGALRFSLRDLLILMVFLGIASAMFATLWRNEAFADWISLLVQAGGFSAVATSMVAITWWTRRWQPWVAVFFSLIGLYAGHALLSDALGIAEYFVYPNWPDKPHLAALFATIPYMLLITFGLVCFRLATEALTLNVSRRTRGVRLPARIVIVCTTLTILPLFSWCYSQMMGRLPIPEENLPAKNSLPRVLALLDEARGRDKLQAAIVETEGDESEQIQAMRRIYGEMQTALDREPCFVSFDFERDANRHYIEARDYSVPRGLARTWGIEADCAATAGRFDKAAEYGVSTAQWGQAHARGGLMIDALLGVAMEGIGVDKLAEIRADISLAAARDTIERLERIDGEREGFEKPLAREWVFADRAYTWRRRFELAMCRISGQRDGFSYDEPIRSSMKRRDATLRLLLTDLALRLFREQEGRLPDTLAELVPEYLKAVPMDPFSEQPLIYRRDGNEYQLYSVWKDGHDDGGNYIQTTQDWPQAGFDLDLDMRRRLSKGAAGS